MDENQVVLLYDSSEDSRKAEALLREEGIPYTAVPSSSYGLPSVSWATMMYDGLLKIRRFAAQWRRTPTGDRGVALGS